ncbi:glutamate--tRNA ligase [Lactobacillus sanfranciscensis]|uniref:Glutamate--tRNA ligase n=1 Tax=Fructilactobacillus sanfranciscensis (strain TMW 1.1304) TaxID=714313 RepID=G2KV09_FRUST|nr:glutamate--tRNA ligase [Fructilactobacillus sanfranciscensis]AEN98898.1 Glutamyl-tRNA synthetase 2 [Fructilactobacillus sanfranciscensis TMW 1.1304]NDR75893.1 glutamate--tRNA ligase [Fructilactobacillus sanfranciscensis]NDR96421.1 glutamate--tRNA ligase [Fructilactobacillus sanfranciscensis]NDS04263.1 glutamate--tRNA ligase [Fructilactobacillus sanfranciscensis]POH18159.1 glutamate--tRNA ligase [Fructilactobacillus sanfranciscensis]
MANNKIRVRYAPSPTGHLHIGNARTAIFNYLFARHYKGKFIIRIEDTDTKRNVADGEKSQLDNLKWLGLDWDEGPDVGGDFGPYRQSERRATYDPLIQKLLDEDKAYYSYKTEEELEAEREEQKARGVMPHYEYEFAGMTEDERKAAIADAEAKGLKPVIRFRVPKNHTYEWDDLVKGHVSFNSDSIGGDFVIVKRDGMPTYNFAVVADDHNMQISHVFRGDDHVANTPKQLMIYEAFGWQAPKFGHMSLIISADTGKKLSKRDETVLQFIEQYHELGYLPDALFNFIVLLGWSPVGEDEIFNQRQFIKMYDESRLSKSPATFDSKKLEWINNQYVKNSDEDTIVDLALRQLIKGGKLPENPDALTIEWARKLIDVYRPQMSYMAQINEMANVFFEDPELIKGDALEEIENETAPVVLKAFAEKIKELPIFDKVEILKTIKSIQKETKIKGRQLWMPIRIAVTHEMEGPELPESIELIGREKTLKHLQQTLDQISK